MFVKTCGYICWYTHVHTYVELNQQSVCVIEANIIKLKPQMNMCKSNMDSLQIIMQTVCKMFFH